MNHKDGCRSPLGADPGRDVREELLFYVDCRVAELMEGGLSEAEATALAKAAFGNLARVRRECEEIQQRRKMKMMMRQGLGSFVQELARSWRALLKKPGYAALAVLTLALGIGANAAIFSVVHTVLIKPLPFPEAGELVQVWGTIPGRPSAGASPADYLDWRKATSFENMAAYRTLGGNLVGGDRPVRLTVANVSGNFFQTFGVSPEVGGVFGPDPDGRGTLQAVLGHGIWSQDFGADQDIVGRTIQLDDRTYEVVGVMPAEFGFPETADIWTRAPFDIPEVRGFRGDLSQARDLWYFRVVGRLSEGIPASTAQAEMDQIATALASAFPANNQDRGVRLVSLHEEVVGSVKYTLLTLMGAVALVFLIACANVANLALVRMLGRREEFAVRAALGASRSRLMAVALAENVWIAVLGGLAGIGVSVAGVRLLATSVLGSLPRGGEVTLNWTVVLFGLGLTLATLALFALLPAHIGANTEPAGGLSRSRGGALGLQTRRIMSTLVAAETALAVVLVLGAGLVLRSLMELQEVDLGFPVEDFASAWVSLPAANAMRLEERVQLYSEFREAVAEIPTVESVALASTSPLSGGPGAGMRGPAGAFIPNESSVRWQVVTANYFETLGLPLLQGRGFTSLDDGRSEPVAVINETLAKRFFPTEDPIGQQINTGLDGRTPEGEWIWVTVVGVASDTRNQGPASAAAPTMFRPLHQAPSAPGGGQMMVIARSSTPSARLPNDIRQAIWSVDPTAPIYSESLGAEIAGRFVATPRLILLLLGIFGGLALTLGAIGIYGVTSYGVGRRVREIGIRLAIGADRGTVVRQQIVSGVRPALIGVGLGMVAALLGFRLISGLLFQVTPTDPLTFVGVCALLVAVSLLATILPAQRAARVDPAATMRWE